MYFDPSPLPPRKLSWRDACFYLYTYQGLQRHASCNIRNSTIWLPRMSALFSRTTALIVLVSPCRMCPWQIEQLVRIRKPWKHVVVLMWGLLRKYHDSVVTWHSTCLCFSVVSNSKCQFSAPVITSVLIATRSSVSTAVKLWPLKKSRDWPRWRSSKRPPCLLSVLFRQRLSLWKVITWLSLLTPVECQAWLFEGNFEMAGPWVVFPMPQHATAPAQWDIFARPESCNFRSWNIVVIPCLLCARGMSSVSAGPSCHTWSCGFTQSHGGFLPRHQWHPVYWSTCHSCRQGGPVVIVWCCGRNFVVCPFVFISVGTKSWTTATSLSRCLTDWRSMMHVCLVFRGNCSDPSWMK